MTGIWEYPDLNSVAEEIQRVFEEAKGDLSTQFPGRAEVINAFRLEQVAILQEWGRGTAQKGEDPLNIMLYTDFDNRQEIIGGDVDISDSQVFREISQNIVERMQNEFQPDETMLEWFGGIVFGSIPDVDYEGSITFFMNQAQPNQTYNLTTRTRLELSDEGQVVPFEPSEPTVEAPEAVEEEPEEETPTDILQYPQKQQLISILSDAFAEAKEAQIRDEAGGEVLEDAQIEQLVVTGEWGRGTGDYGEDQLSILMSLGVEGVDNPNQLPGFARQSQQLGNNIENAIDETELMGEWFAGIAVTTAADNFLDRSLEVNLRGDSPQRAYNLTTNSIIRLEGGELSIEPVELAEPEEPEEEPEEVTEEDLLEEEFPGIPVELIPFAVEDNQLEVPAGKETKAVEPRPMYEFEVELATPGDADTTVEREINEGVGEAIGSQRFATEEPASTFPRTGVYVKWHLFYRGPSYINEIYKDLVIYSAYISSIHEARMKPGRYSSFREFM